MLRGHPFCQCIAVALITDTVSSKSTDARHSSDAFQAFKDKYEQRLQCFESLKTVVVNYDFDPYCCDRAEAEELLLDLLRPKKRLNWNLSPLTEANVTGDVDIKWLNAIAQGECRCVTREPLCAKITSIRLLMLRFSTKIAKTTTTRLDT